MSPSTCIALSEQSPSDEDGVSEESWGWYCLGGKGERVKGEEPGLFKSCAWRRQARWRVQRLEPRACAPPENGIESGSSKMRTNLRRGGRKDSEKEERTHRALCNWKNSDNVCFNK